MAQSRKPVPVVGIIAAAIAAGLGAFAVNRNRSGNIEAALAKASAEMNKTAPRMMDPNVRMDSTSAGPGRTLTYRYTLVNLVKDESFDTKRFEDAARPTLVNEYRTNPALKVFRDAGVSMNYQYSDKNGALIAMISIGPQDLKDTK
jgi:hypothetical protein